MTGFIGTPTLADIEQLQERILSLQKQVKALTERVAALEKPGTELAVVEKKRPATRGSRLAEGWVPKPETVDKMMAELQVPKDVLIREHRKFCDHFYSAPGQRGVKVDWDRAWCNWMRTAAERGLPYRTVSQHGNDDKVRGWMEVGRAEAE